jgi:hypothetical protein
VNVQVPVNLSSRSPRRYVRGMEVFHSFLTLALDEGEWSASHDCFIPWGGAHGFIEQGAVRTPEPVWR